MTWRDEAACQGHNPDLWFPDVGHNRQAREAKAICRACAVRAECLSDALRSPNDVAGIRGGVGINARNGMRRRRREVA